MRLDCDVMQQPQQSQWWVQPLPNQQQANVFLVADSLALQQAVSRLNLQGPRSLTALDIQGVNLRAAAGRFCLMQLAFWDGGGLQCFLFDIMSLGEEVGALMAFLQNPHAPKFVFNAQLATTVLAHKFGITLSGVLDVGTAYQMLENGRTLKGLVDYFEWSNVAMPGQRTEWAKMEKDAELWAHRPLARPTVQTAVTGICALHATYPALSSRLGNFYGPPAMEMLAGYSHRLVSVAASAGWSCRNAGLWIGEQGAKVDDQDAELDDWLTKRFGAKKGPAAANRRLSPENQIRAQKAELPVTAIRENDSPRTASWRAAVAEITIPIRESRQRSGSPTLENWLARRTQAKAGKDEHKSRRASSVPAPRSSAQQDKDKLAENAADSGPFGIGLPFMRDFIRPSDDKRAWAEILEDEQAKEAEEEDDIFADLQAQEKMRLAESDAQAKRGTKK